MGEKQEKKENYFHSVVDLTRKTKYPELICLSKLHTIEAPMSNKSENKLMPRRHVHNSDYGTMYPMETPESEKIGILKNLSIEY